MAGISNRTKVDVKGRVKPKDVINCQYVGDKPHKKSRYEAWMPEVPGFVGQGATSNEAVVDLMEKLGAP